MNPNLPRFRRVENTENEVEIVEKLEWLDTSISPPRYECFLWDHSVSKYRKYVYQGDELVECIE